VPTKSDDPEDLPGSGPIRTCVVTRERHRTADLVHLVPLDDGAIAVDRAGKLEGRGAWVCADRVTLAALEAKPGPLARALKRDQLRVAGLLEQVRASNLVHVLDLLSLAARSGRLASGGEQVESAARGGDLVGFVIASDASPKSVESIRAKARDVPAWTLPLDREALGLRIGKGPRAVVGIRPGGPSMALADQLRRMDRLR
jgi:predicted RNA-binding protein YlxR (DUF448 family)/ribosomal protein L7Ae-like RNA K-turn-binding protein